MTLTHPEPGLQGHRIFISVFNGIEIALNIPHERIFLPERDYMTFRHFAIANPSVCLSLTFVPSTQGVEAFGNILFAAVYLSHPLTSVQKFTVIVPEKPLRRGVKCKRASKI